LHWKDALQALRENHEQQATRQRMWERTFAQAKADLQREEAIIFLGEDALGILRTLGDDDPTPATPPAPAWPALLAGAATLAAAAAAYTLSLARVRAGMQ